MNHAPCLTQRESAAPLGDRLATLAPRYFEVFREERPHVECTWESQRPNSALYEFQLAASHDVVRRVIVKVPRQLPVEYPRADEGAQVERPRLYPRAPIDRKGHWEYAALQLIDAHFRGLADPRFGAIRPLDRWMPEDILVLERCPDRSLRSALVASHRWSGARGTQSVVRQCQHAGAWLRQFHGLEAASYVRTRNASLVDFENAVDRYGHYLADQTGQPTLFRNVVRTLNQVATTLYVTPPPLAVVHGDFAPRNVLVSRDDRVTVLDTMACWRAPAWEDLAYFCLALKTHGRQCATLNRWNSTQQLKSWEAALVSGYFGETEVPWRWLQLLECLLTLDRWSAQLQRTHATAGSKRLASSVLRTAFWNRRFRQHLAGLLKQLSIKG